MAFDFSFLQDDDFSNVSVYEGGKEQGYQGPDLNQFVGGGGGASLDPNDYMPERRADDSGDVMEAGRSGIFGALLAGATTVAGVAMDNPYMVGGGGAAGKNYSEQYGRMNKSLLEEQRANRLADSAMMRQMNMARFQRDLTAEDRAKADQRYEQEFALKQAADRRAQSADERAGAAEGRAGDLHEAQMRELNKTPAQKAKEAAEVAKIVKKAELEVATEATAAQNTQQLNHLRSTLEGAGASEAVIQRATLQLSLKQAGLDIKDTKAKAFSGEQKVKLQQTAKNEYLARPANQERLETEPEVVEAEADRHGIQTAAAIEAELNKGNSGESLIDAIMGSTGGGGGGGTGGGTGGDQGYSKEPEQRAWEMLINGTMTPQQMRQKATTPQEKAVADAAIRRFSADKKEQLAGTLGQKDAEQLRLLRERRAAAEARRKREEEEKAAAPSRQQVGALQMEEEFGAMAPLR